MLTTPEFLLWALAAVFLIFFGEGLAALLGYMVFATLTLGKVNLQGPKDQEVKFPWHGFARDGGGRLIVESQVASFVGILILLLGALAYAAWKSGAIGAT